MEFKQLKCSLSVFFLPPIPIFYSVYLFFHAFIPRWGFYCDYCFHFDLFLNKVWCNDYRRPNCRAGFSLKWLKPGILLFKYKRPGAFFSSMQERWLPQIPGGVCHRRRSQGGGREQPRGVQGRHRYRHDRTGFHSSDSTRSCPQLLRILLRNSELAGESVPAGEDRIWRRDRRAGHAQRGELQRFDANHATSQRQPNAVDLGHER